MAPLQFRALVEYPPKHTPGEPEYVWEYYSTFDQPPWLDKNVIVKDSQAIGIPDREGTPIFEGDILKFDETEWGDDTGIFVVQWADEEAGFYGAGLPQEWSVYCTIIGNRFEQPELLEDN